MRLRFLIAALGAIAVSGATLADEFPYMAYVNSTDVYVRSGPGRDYYPTDKMEKGEKVEVYRHDPGGWCAIRPPHGSFTWVSKRHVTLEREDLATINTPRVVARVGSAFSDVRDVIQVRLDKGESVELLEPPSDDSMWCKIAPPAGEFRWVFAKLIDRNLPAGYADLDAQREGGYSTASNRGEQSRDVRLASASSDAGSPQTPQEQFESRGARLPGGASYTSTAQRELDAIDLELSAIVVGDISSWNFDELDRRADAALRESQTALERGRARVLLDKLARFRDIRQRHEALRAHGVVDRHGATATSEMTAKEASRYDGIGRLSPVISEKVGGPQYALVDSTNSVVSFITPAPGVNLRPYVDHFVGVNGQRGYMTDLQRQHINVQRVTLLDTERR